MGVLQDLLEQDDLQYDDPFIKGDGEDNTPSYIREQNSVKGKSTANIISEGVGEFGEAVVEDPVGVAKAIGTGIYESGKEFVQNPVETTSEFVSGVGQSIKNVGTKSLLDYLPEGVDEEMATEEQMTQARQDRLNDILNASIVVPAASAATLGAKALASIIPELEMDPNTVGMNLGNIKFKKEKLADADLNDENLDTLTEELMSVEAFKAAGMGANGSPPLKSIKGYKLFRINRETGELYPLYVDAKTSIPLDEWVPAIAGNLAKSGKVKSSIGELAYRPGFHAAQLPWVNHIGSKFEISKDKFDELQSQGANNLIEENTQEGTKYFERLRDDDTVWAEVEMPNDVDWQSEANARARIKKDGEPEAKSAHIADQIPVGGTYLYNTKAGNPNQWLIGGSMKINRVLDDAEVEKINQEAGVLGSDMPRKPYSESTSVDTQTDELFGIGHNQGPPLSTTMKNVLDARANEMSMPVSQRTGAKGAPLFDTSEEAYQRNTVPQDKIYVPRNPNPEAPLPKNNRAQILVDRREDLAQALADRMRPFLGKMPQYFYNTEPIREKALAMGYTKEYIDEWMKEFSEAYAATSPRTETAQNLRNATLVMAKRKQGIPLDEVVGKGTGGLNEKGYPMMIGESGIHGKLAKATEDGGIDPDGNTKPFTFAKNVEGNLQGATIDTHAIRGALDVLNELDPGSIPEEWIKPKWRQAYKDDPSQLNAATWFEDTLASQAIDKKKIQTEYAVFADLYDRSAEILGVSPAEAQSMGWFGSGSKTGLLSEEKTIVDLLDERIGVTANVMGFSKDEIFRFLMDRDIPLLSVVGGSALAATAMAPQPESGLMSPQEM